MPEWQELAVCLLYSAARNNTGVFM